MPIFGYLDSYPIRIWDEARLAINAYEMLKNGDFIVTHYDNNPDMWNTKPPLMIWCQVFFMKISRFFCFFSTFLQHRDVENPKFMRKTNENEAWTRKNS